MDDINGSSALPWLKETPSDASDRVSAWSRYAERFSDIHNVIELTLTEARDATRADGGTVYIVTDSDRLRFAYFQNDTLSRGSHDARNHYVNAELPLNERSIAGYAALTKQTININDVAHISSDAPYSFNSTFDESSGYHTVSMLTVPIVHGEGRSIGVLQLINCLDSRGVPTPFGRNETIYAEQVAAHSAPIISRSLETLGKFDDMLSTAEERVRFRRIGSYAAEIYASWAKGRELSSEELMLRKDRLRLAAMTKHVQGGTADDHVAAHDRELFSHITKVADAIDSHDGKSFDSVIAQLTADDAAHLDPEVVRAAVAISPTLSAIASRYGQAASPAGGHGFTA